MHVEYIRKRVGKKLYVTTLIRESYREGKKVKHRTIANISKLPQHVIASIKAWFVDPSVSSHKLNDFKIQNSREYGASAAFAELARQLELDKIIYSRKEAWRQDVLTMVVGRLVYQGSKLHLTHLHNDSALWEIFGYQGESYPDVTEHCYKPLDCLLARQAAIQTELAKRYLSNGMVILYDITSSYLEGEYETSELVKFGYSRDQKRGHEQIVIGLLANAKGCPVAVEVFRGNTQDQTTVLGQAKKLAEMYQVKDVIFVGDRGMLTPKRIDELNALGYQTLTVLSRPQIRELWKRGLITPELFINDGIIEIADENPSVRYFLCKNPNKEQENKATRDILIAKTKACLEKIAILKIRKNDQQKSAQIGKVLAQYKVGKFFNWSIRNGQLMFQIVQNKIAAEEAFDGCYIIRTDSQLSKENAVANYKSLTSIEKAFRNIKTMSLEIRPIYHHLDNRIKAHVFLCMLAYYVEWHALQRLKPLFLANGIGAKRRFSFTRVIERLKSIRIQNCSLNEIQISGVISTPDSEQQKILQLLKNRK
jgi:transposase